MLKLNGFTVLLCFIAVFFQFQGKCLAATTDASAPAPNTTTSTTDPNASTTPTTTTTNGTVKVTTTAIPGQATKAPAPDIGALCPAGSCKEGLICDTSCKIAAGNNCTTSADHCQNGTSCATVSTASTCTVDAGFVGSACANSTLCTAANTECSSSHKCQCKMGYNKVAATLECSESGSATVMASVLVLAVAFVKTQLF